MTECQECYLLTFNLWPSQTLVDNHTYTVGKLTRPESDTQVPLLRPESRLDDTRTQFVRNQLNNFIALKLVLWIALDWSWLLWIALDYSGLLWIALDCSGWLWIALDCFGLLWITLNLWFEMLWNIYILHTWTFKSPRSSFLLTLIGLFGRSLFGKTKREEKMLLLLLSLANASWKEPQRFLRCLLMIGKNLSGTIWLWSFVFHFLWPNVIKFY